MRKIDYSNKHIILFLCFVPIYLINGCGGGTSGTGVDTQDYRGVVLDRSGSPISNARVTIEETGDSDTTEVDGTFDIQSTTNLVNATLLIETKVSETKVAVDQIQSVSQSIAIAIDENVASHQKSAGYDIRAKLVGVCDPFFVNSRPIIQTEKIPTSKICPLLVSIRTIDGGLANRKFQIQSNTCDASASWKLISEGQTGADGTGKINFNFEDTKSKCIYRILVPINDKRIKPISFEIRTLSFQNKK